jgi:hypothetical protein
MNNNFFLTFDCEDFINEKSTSALYHLLDLLKRQNIKGLFFLSGHIAEKISKYPKILDLLEDQEIGYHSSAHSVRPIIVEFTDIENYEHARQISIIRETSHINPVTGAPEGVGGINVLRNLFPSKRINAFRAPGYSYSPPHLEALNYLGITCDFSTNLSKRVVSFKNLTFYPFPCLVDLINITNRAKLLRSMLINDVTVLAFHPHNFVTTIPWDSLYHNGNPNKLVPVPEKSSSEISQSLKRFQSFLSWLKRCEKVGILQIDPTLKVGKKRDEWSNTTIASSYKLSAGWSQKFFKYNPRFVLSHFRDFFSLNLSE